MSDPTLRLALPALRWRVGGTALAWVRFGSEGEPADLEGGGREGQDTEGPEYLDGPAEQDQREPREKGPS